VSLSGRQRVVARGPGGLGLQDVSSDGRVLLTHGNGRILMMTLAPGQTTERDLSWLDGSILGDLSDDGRTLLFTEEGAGAGSLTYSTWLRQTDGSPAVRLGDGLGCGLSPDGKWALAVRLEPQPAQLVLIPTGPGEAKRLTHDAISHRIAAWFPDGRHVLFAGSEPGKGSHLYVQDLEGGAPRAITPDSDERRALWIRRPVSPDGRLIVWFDGERFLLCPVEGGSPRPLMEIGNGEIPVRWDSDGRALYLRERQQTSLKIFRLDVSTGQKQLWKEIPAPAPTWGSSLLLTPDGKSYVHGYGISSEALYLVEGLK